MVSKCTMSECSAWQLSPAIYCNHCVVILGHTMYPEGAVCKYMFVRRCIATWFLHSVVPSLD